MTEEQQIKEFLAAQRKHFSDLLASREYQNSQQPARLGQPLDLAHAQTLGNDPLNVRTGSLIATDMPGSLPDGLGFQGHESHGQGVLAMNEAYMALLDLVDAMYNRLDDSGDRSEMVNACRAARENYAGAATTYIGKSEDSELIVKFLDRLAEELQKVPIVEQDTHSRSSEEPL